MDYGMTRIDGLQCVRNNHYILLFACVRINQNLKQVNLTPNYGKQVRSENFFKYLEHVTGVELNATNA